MRLFRVVIVRANSILESTLNLTPNTKKSGCDFIVVAVGEERGQGGIARGTLSWVQGRSYTALWHSWSRPPSRTASWRRGSLGLSWCGRACMSIESLHPQQLGIYPPGNRFTLEEWGLGTCKRATSSRMSLGCIGKSFSGDGANHKKLMRRKRQG